MVIAKNIHKYYDDTEVLKGVNLTIDKGEVVAIVGPSGAGKTTLLQILGTLDTPTKEEDFLLKINGITIQNLNDKQIAAFRNEHIGYIFQFHQLLPEFTALENICIPAFIGNKDRKQTEQKAKELLRFLGLENRMKHKPNELSGGEQQRVAVARALASKPNFILADEPTANLDSKSSENLLSIMQKLNKNEKTTFIFSTHDQRVIDKANRIVTIEDGKIISDTSQ